ncbi:PDI(protein disulfide isomerase)-like protein [Oryza sativa Japonica Group]|uniref:PDI(Protein disulfide isomerase)-like protein n=1 Tax=Oryza sativa subsp. japonica TaxID=39947 RepID=Q5QMT5_ORYSJ|nr:PDI(protein disulfide isomerase)-like protein [Oryza sativa Japonica Group]BAD73273.1 PDI(protein disulfide isomerase)-like protein [Oryza sativa Japonica Group]
MASSRAGGTPQKPDHPPTRCRSQAKMWFRRHCSFQSLVRARDQKRGSDNSTGAEEEELTPGKKQVSGTDRTRGLLISQEREAVVGTWTRCCGESRGNVVSGCKRIAT